MLNWVWIFIVSSYNKDFLTEKVPSVRLFRTVDRLELLDVNDSE